MNLDQKEFCMISPFDMLLSIIIEQLLSKRELKNSKKNNPLVRVSSLISLWWDITRLYKQSAPLLDIIVVMSALCLYNTLFINLLAIIASLLGIV